MFAKLRLPRLLAPWNVRINNKAIGLSIYILHSIMLAYNITYICLHTMHYALCLHTILHTSLMFINNHNLRLTRNGRLNERKIRQELGTLFTAWHGGDSFETLAMLLN